MNDIKIEILEEFTIKCPSVYIYFCVIYNIYKIINKENDL